MSNSLELTLFGSPEVRTNGHLVTGFRSSKAQALLYYLAVTGRRHTRPTLAGLLWGDQPESAARASLSKCLSNLHDLLGDAVLIERQTVAFNRDHPYHLDTDRFMAGVGQLPTPETIHRLQAALAFYRGDFLEGFYVRDAPDFEQWLLTQRAHYREVMINGLHGLAIYAEQQGDLTQAITHHRRLLRLEAWREEAHRQLMTLLARTGQRAAAHRQYEECKRVLRAELDVEPAPETVTLAQSISSMPLESKVPLAAVRTNLPVSASSFIGRQRELTEVERLLTAGGTQRTTAEDIQSFIHNRRLAIKLVTLTGAGGSGKTRLAIQVATNLVDTYEDGVWWVDLAPLLDDEILVPQALAKALGVREIPSQTLPETLTQFLLSKRLLLVLDNCERLIDACARLANAFISRCPTLQILATSREPLGITGERVYQVPTLALPDSGVFSLPEVWLRYEAIQLFVERSQALEAIFGLTEENATAVWQICRKLDGIPLAIELAAARVRVLTVDQIAARLNDSLSLLTAGSRTVPPRHQTLRATMDWSYDLLADAERVLLRRLAVFAGSFPFEAIENVCGPLPTPILDLLSHLVDKSLVMVERHEDGVLYRLLDTIREYAYEKLLASEEESHLRASHLNFYLQFAEAAQPQLNDSEQGYWSTRLEHAHDNVRVALGWVLAQGKREQALRLSGAMASFWNQRGYWHEGRKWLAEALTLNNEGDSSLSTVDDVAVWSAKALYQAGTLAWQQCDLAVAHELLEKSLTLYRQLDKQDDLADVLGALGAVAFMQGKYAATLAHLDETLTVRRELGYKDRTGMLRYNLGIVALNQGEYAKARTYLEESLKLAHAAGHTIGISAALNALGNVANMQGEYEAAQALHRESLALQRELGWEAGVAKTLNDMANVTAKQGGNGAAQALYHESLILYRKLGGQHGIVSALSGLARICQVQGHLQFATKLLGAVEALLTTMNARLEEPEHSDKERAIAFLRIQLDEANFTIAWKEGHSLTLEQAITLAHQNE